MWGVGGRGVHTQGRRGVRGGQARRCCDVTIAPYTPLPPPHALPTPTTRAEKSTHGLYRGREGAEHAEN